ncbi:hypothetical protein K461DRAFT_170164 [Myriangium duriaei CBS 260.36]|uniref:Uncharacterized protein n=1 Tax=Myriangium duriaei CBS 260.36 TaxID=1168546 RepID=A0A9P4J2L7_9PEZI|nr:hypothetical protein K461DRAFT_170164 [Myriangium duriaei CBS 260.36]
MSLSVFSWQASVGHFPSAGGKGNIIVSAQRCFLAICFFFNCIIDTDTAMRNANFLCFQPRSSV